MARHNPKVLMAKKPSKSILGSLKKMLGSSEKPSDPHPKKSAPPKKKPVAPAAEKRAPSEASPREPHPAPSPGEAGAQGPDAEAKPDRKKTPNQPWYRHRQRW